MLCLRCDHQGSIYKIRIDEINKIVYWCDECDGTWEDPSKILLYGKGTKLDIDFYSLVEYLENHGLVYMKTPITNLGTNWDKSVLCDDTLVFCPHCGVHGILYETESHTLGSTFYFCDNCNAMWVPGETIDQKKDVKFLGFLHAKQLDYSRANLGYMEVLNKAKVKN